MTDQEQQLPFAARGEERRFFDGCRDGRLLIQQCGRCRTYVFYPRSVCPECFSRELAWAESSGRGVVHTFTVQHRAPAGYDRESPYVLAIIELEEGVRLMSHVDAPHEHVRIDMPVAVRFDHRGSVRVPVFVPAADPQS